MEIFGVFEPNWSKEHALVRGGSSFQPYSRTVPLRLLLLLLTSFPKWTSIDSQADTIVAAQHHKSESIITLHTRWLSTVVVVVVG